MDNTTHFSKNIIHYFLILLFFIVGGSAYISKGHDDVEAATATSKTATTKTQNVMTDLFNLQANSTEILIAKNYYVIKPTLGDEGRLIRVGSANMSFASVSTSSTNGIVFSNANVGKKKNSNDIAYLQFPFKAINSSVNQNEGEISFSIRSKYSFRDRIDISNDSRFIFSMYTGKVAPFLFSVKTVKGVGKNASSTLMFGYRVAGGRDLYFIIPSGKEDEWFGMNKTLNVRMAWKNKRISLYMNDVLVQSTLYTTYTNLWPAKTSYIYLGSLNGSKGGIDIISDFKVSMMATKKVTTEETVTPTSTPKTILQKLIDILPVSLPIVSTSPASTYTGPTGGGGGGGGGGGSTAPVTPTPVTPSNNTPTAPTTTATSSPTTTPTSTPTTTPTNPTTTPPVTPPVAPSYPLINIPTTSPLSANPTNNANTVILVNKGTTTAINYPLQIGRPFKQGEIMNYPQVAIGNIGLFTQAEVKQRWPDGSVKHAIISVIIPSLPVNSTTTLRFANQTTGNNTALTKTQMLSSNFDFDATMDLGASGTSSARTMLQNNDYTVWSSGPVATTIILADHTITRKYDIGRDQLRSFRPIYEVTFWASLNKYEVRYIGEIANTEAIQDMEYNLKLGMGYSAPTTIYTKNGFLHYRQTRWTKTFWSGAAPEPRINIDNNVAYLTETYMIPNYDASIKVPESAIVNEYNNWNVSYRKKDLGEAGFWQRAMPTTGGRMDIGVYPSWSVKWLYTGDWREREVALTQADLAGSWCAHLREATSSKYYDRAQTLSGYGLPISKTNRLSNRQGNCELVDYYTRGTDIIKVYYKSATNTPWAFDDAHLPEAYSLQYMLTGDHYYLEEMHFWNSYLYNMTISQYNNGPVGNEGGYFGQTRAMAWVLRTRLEFYNLIPDSMPIIKNQWKLLINEMLAQWHAGKLLNEPTYTSYPGYIYYSIPTNLNRMIGTTTPMNSPVAVWNYAIGGTNITQPQYATGTIYAAHAPWMNNFLIYSLGRAKELGFKSDLLLKYLGDNQIERITNGVVSPYTLGDYGEAVMPTSTKKLFSSWAEEALYYLPQGTGPNQYDYKGRFMANLGGTEQGYTDVARAALSMLTNLTNGTQAWNWMVLQMSTTTIMTRDAANPKWALLPR